MVVLFVTTWEKPEEMMERQVKAELGNENQHMFLMI